MKRALPGLLIVCALLALVAACSPGRLAGTGSEITNGVVASAAGPADSALIVAFPASYIPCVRNAGMPETTYTDKTGAFSMRLADTAWNILIYDRTRQLGAFAERRKGEPFMGFIELDSLGAIAGTASISAISAEGKAFIGIAGSPFYTKVLRDSSFLISRVPQHSYTIYLWIIGGTGGVAENPTSALDSVIAGASVVAGRTTTIILNR